MVRSLLMAAALAMVGCATMTPREVANNRRRMSAPKLGCAEVDTVVPEDPTMRSTTWTVSCGGRIYACHGEITGGAFQDFHVVCDPASR